MSESNKKKGDKKALPFSQRIPGGILRKLDCFSDVDEMIRSGVFIRKVASFIQTTCGEMTDVPERVLITALRNYKDYVFSDDAVFDEASIAEGKDIEKDDDPLRILKALERRFRFQEERIDREAEVERKIGKNFSTTHKEMQVLLGYGREILDRQEKLGMLMTSGRESDRQRHGSGMPGRIDVAKVVTDPKARQRVMRYMETLLGDGELMEEVSRRKKKEGQKAKKRRKRKE